MKPNHIYQFILFMCLSICLLSSCSEGSFTKIVDIDLAEEDKQLAVVAKMNTNSDNQFILVSETLSVLENTNNFTSLDNAKINITTPDQGIIQPSFNTDVNLYSLSDYTFQTGLEYSIEIDHPNYAPMAATVKVPSAPEILHVDVQLANTNDLLDVDIISVRFKDPPNELNSYLFEGIINFKDNETGEIYWGEYNFDISENILEYNDEVISDITFDGKEYELIILGNRRISIDNATPYSIELEVTSITQELLLYENSIDQAYDSNDNPFVEPSTIYTNFDNGFGIFTIDATERIEILL